MDPLMVGHNFSAKHRHETGLPHTHIIDWWTATRVSRMFLSSANRRTLQNKARTELGANDAEMRHLFDDASMRLRFMEPLVRVYSGDHIYAQLCGASDAVIERREKQFVDELNTIVLESMRTQLDAYRKHTSAFTRSIVESPAWRRERHKEYQSDRLLVRPHLHTNILVRRTLTKSGVACVSSTNT